jgi:hypothetical protein
MKVAMERVIAMLHNGMLIAQDAAHAERAKQLIREDYTRANVEALNGVDGIEAELVEVTPDEWEAMND